MPSEAKEICTFLQGRTIGHPAWGPWLHKGTGQTQRGKETSISLLFVCCLLFHFVLFGVWLGLVFIHLPFFIEHSHFQMAAVLHGGKFFCTCFMALGHFAFSLSSRFLVLDVNSPSAEDSTNVHAHMHLPQLFAPGW